MTLFRALRELLINVAKHAKTDEARVEIRKQDGHIAVVVSDRGVGFEDGEHRGFGLLNLLERITALGGTVDVDSSSDSGTTVTILAPDTT